MNENGAKIRIMAIAVLLVLISGIVVTQPYVQTGLESSSYISEDGLWEFTEVTEIYPSDKEQFEPDIDGDFVVWRQETDGVTDNYDVYGCYLDNMTVFPICDHNTSDQYYPKVNGDNIVWSDDRFGNSDVFCRNLELNYTFMIANSSYEEIPFSVYNHYVLYLNYHNNELHLHNLNTSNDVVIAQYIARADMWGDYIAYTSTIGGNAVYLYQISTNQTITAVSDQYFIYDIGVYDNYVIYKDYYEGFGSAQTLCIYSIEDDRYYKLQNDMADDIYEGAVSSHTIAFLFEEAGSFYDQLGLSSLEFDLFNETITKVTNDTLLRDALAMSDEYIVFEQFQQWHPMRGSTPYEHDLVYVRYLSTGEDITPRYTTETVYDMNWMFAFIILLVLLGGVTSYELYDRYSHTSWKNEDG